MSRLFFEGLLPHAWSICLCALRLLPVAFLCPVLGGSAVPSIVKLSLVLSLAGGLHFAGGVGFDASQGMSGLPAAGKELGFGLSLGLIASLPFDAARIGGRLVDLFRGSSAEAALPFVAARESASGDLLYRLLVSLCVSTGAMPMTLRALFRTFQAVPLGASVEREGAVLELVRLAGVAFGTGLAIGAPVAALALTVDALLGLLGRMAAPLNLQELATPAKLLGGAVLLWLSLGLVSDRLMAEVSELSQVLATRGRE